MARQAEGKAEVRETRIWLWEVKLWMENKDIPVTVRGSP
jgi:hypothetical protein